MYKPRITRVVLIENPYDVVATVYYLGNVRRTYRRRAFDDDRPLPKTVREFMHCQEVTVEYKDRTNAYVPWRAWVYRRLIEL